MRAAVAGRDDIMALFDRNRVSADRFVPQVGTLSGNPIAATAGLATLEILKRPGTYERYFETGKKLMTALSRAIDAAGLDAQVVGAPPMFDIVFANGEVRNYRDTARADAATMAKLNRLLRERGILKGDNKYYVCTAIDEADVAETIDIWSDAINALTSG